MMDNEEEGLISINDECQEAIIIKTMLQRAGFMDYDPAVLTQLMYYMYDHVTNILEVAMLFTTHANRTEMTNSDVLLALKMLKEHETALFTKNVVKELANEKNSIALPEVKQQFGIRLPPEKYCLANTNYKLKSATKTSNPVVVQLPPKPQFMQNAPLLIPTSTSQISSNENNIAYAKSIVKKPIFSNIQEQRIVFRPNFKINIKSVDTEQQAKKQKLN